MSHKCSRKLIERNYTIEWVMQVQMRKSTKVFLAQSTDLYALMLLLHRICLFAHKNTAL